MTPLIEGAGGLFSAVARALERTCPGGSTSRAWSWRPGAGPATAPLVLSIRDHPDAARDRRLHARFARAGVDWLPVRGSLAEIWVGPRVGSQPGCIACLELRRGAAHRSGTALRRIDRLLARNPRSRPPRHSERAGALVLELAQAWSELESDPAVPAPFRLVVRLALPQAHPESLRLVAVPGCPVCGGPRDTAAGGRLREDGLRASGAESAPPLHLAALVVDRLIGIVSEAHADAGGDPPTAEACVPNHDPHGDRRRRLEWGFGCAETPRAAIAIAVMEALERYCSMPRGLALERARASDLGDRALDPRRLVLHDEAQYSRPGFPFERFDPGVDRDWVWAWSVGGGRKVAVPADLVFYRRRWHQRQAGRYRPLAFNTSSGCAIATRAADAALNAVLELVERDGLLLTWYRGLPPRQLAPEAATDPGIPPLLEQLKASGYDACLFDVMAADVRLPCVWAMAVNRTDEGLKTLSGAACHPDPERAVLKALREVAGQLHRVRRSYAARQHGARRMLRGEALRQPGDHALLYGLPEAFGRLGWLFQGERSSLSPARHFGQRGAALAASPEQWQPTVYSTLLDAGFEILLADMTASDLGSLGLVAVRALIPGTLPLTFGAGNERLAGSLRLGSGPAHLLPHPLG